MTSNLWLHRAVQVITGEYRGKRGVVTAVDDEELTVRDIRTQATFRVLTNEVKTIE